MKLTQEQVIAWAREVELFATTEPNGYQVWIPENLEAFANLVAAAEREVCAGRAKIALLGADRGLANRVDYAIRERGAP